MNILVEYRLGHGCRRKNDRDVKLEGIGLIKWHDNRLHWLASCEQIAQFHNKGIS
jgi:hypothetical protein